MKFTGTIHNIQLLPHGRHAAPPLQRPTGCRCMQGKIITLYIINPLQNVAMVKYFGETLTNKNMTHEEIKS
jgi:hypothetical protein